MHLPSRLLLRSSMGTAIWVRPGKTLAYAAHPVTKCQGHYSYCSGVLSCPTGDDVEIFCHSTVVPRTATTMTRRNRPIISVIIINTAEKLAFVIKGHSFNLQSVFNTIVNLFSVNERQHYILRLVIDPRLARTRSRGRAASTSSLSYILRVRVWTKTAKTKAKTKR